MTVELDNRTGNSLWTFLVRLDSDTIAEIFHVPNGDELSEGQISSFTESILKLKARRISELDDRSCDALCSFLTRTGVDTIEAVLKRPWAGMKLTAQQIEQIRFDIFTLYSMHLYVPSFKVKRKSSCSV